MGWVVDLRREIFRPSAPRTLQPIQIALGSNINQGDSKRQLVQESELRARSAPLSKYPLQCTTPRVALTLTIQFEKTNPNEWYWEIVSARQEL